MTFLLLHKNLCLIVILFLTILALIFISKSEEQIFRNERNWLSDKQLQWLAEHPQIFYSVSPHFIPIEYLDKNGQHAGFTSEFIKEIEHLLSVKFTLVPTKTWSENLAFLKNKTIDFTALASHSPDREDYMRLSKDYVTFQSFLYLNKELHKESRPLKKLNNATLAIPEGYVTANFIKTNYPKIRIKHYPTPRQCIQAASRGDTDGFIGGGASVAYLLKQEHITNLLFSGPIGFSAEMGMGVRKDLPILEKILTAALGQITQKQKLEFEDKWYHNYSESNFWNQNFLKICSVCTTLAAVICLYLILRSKADQKQSSQERNLHEARSRTFASVSHDIRAPLAAMNGMLALAAKEQNQEKRKQQLTDALTSSTYLLNLTNEILMFTKVNAGSSTLKLKAQPLPPVIKTTVELFKNQSKQNVIFTADIDLAAIENKALVMIDSLRLQQVFTNLISNALKFTNEGSVTLKTYWINSAQNTTLWQQSELESLSPSRGFLIAEVIDTGIGIKAERLESIFGHFEQAESEIEKNFGGSGLGLSICRDICHLYGGEIKAISTLGQGSSFSFALPLDTTPLTQES